MTSRLAQMQARFQQKQMHEKEEKLVRLYENQQQRAFERVGRGSAGSTTSLGSTGGGKVRQMFDERRQKAGVDKSYPLEPLKSSRPTTKTVIKSSSTVQKSVTQIRNGKPLVNKREVVHSIYNNNDGDETYEEHRFEDDNTERLKMLDMFNKHNLNDNLDDEQLPQIGFDEVDEPFVRGKLANVGGKLPSQNGVARTVVETKTVTKTNGVNPRKKEPTKVVTKRTTATVSPKTSRTVAASNSRSMSNPTTPSKSATPSNTKTGRSSLTHTSSKAPTATRPSAKQASKSCVVRDDLEDCKYCGRRFAADRLQVHENICSKTGKKKRKIYDATRHRLQGTELEPYVAKGKVGKSTSKPIGDGVSRHADSTKVKSTSKKDWRKTHEEFIAAIRAAKTAQAHVARGGKLSDLPPPPPSSNPDYVQCPHCGRRFNEAAAQRHIPKCATFLHNKPKTNGPATNNNRGNKIVNSRR